VEYTSVYVAVYGDVVVNTDVPKKVRYVYAEYISVVVMG
jgi:hypothetical protein